MRNSARVKQDIKKYTDNKATVVGRIPSGKAELQINNIPINNFNSFMC